MRFLSKNGGSTAPGHPRPWSRREAGRPHEHLEALKQGFIAAGRPLDARSVFVFVIGLTAFQEISLLGTMLVSESLMLLSLPLLWREISNQFREKVFVTTFVVSVIAVIGTFVSDFIVNENSLGNHLKGVARVVFVMLHFAFWSALLSGDMRLLRSYLWGLVPGSVIACVFVAQYGRFDFRFGGYEFWLYRVAPALNSFVFIFALLFYRRKRSMVLAVFLAVATILAVNAARSQAAILLAVGLATMMLWVGSARRQAGRPSIGIVKLGMIAFALISTSYFAYLYLAPAGHLGEAQRLKFEMQSQSAFGATPWGILMTGRATTLAAFHAALERPWFGFGSWTIPEFFMYDAYRLLEMEIPAYLASDEWLTSGTAGHSVIFGAWAANGIFAVPIWMVALWLVTRLTVSSFRIESAYTPYLLFVSFSSIFMILFNPLNSGARATLGLAMGVSLVLLKFERRLRVSSVSEKNH